MEKSSRFLFITILFDVFLLGLLGFLPLPGPQVVWVAVAVFVVSPLLTYVLVYRDRFGPRSGPAGEADDSGP